MAEDDAPPLYTASSSESEIQLPPEITRGPLQLNTGDIFGLRSQILENASTLFTLSFGAKAAVPADFRINTIKTPTSENREDAGKVYAFILFRHSAFRSQYHNNLALFVNGPAADTTEQALRALLQKMEVLMGQKWRKAIDTQLITRHEAYYLG